MFKLPKKRKFFTYILAAFILAIAGFYAWWSFIFFPNDYAITRREALLESKTQGLQVISSNLISNIDKAKLEGKFEQKKIETYFKKILKKGYYIKNDSFNTSKRRDLVFRFATGHHGIWVDERESVILPARSSITWNEFIKADSFLEFSLLALQETGICTLVITSQNDAKILKEYKVKKYIPQYKFKDVKLKAINIGYKKARADLKWRDYLIDLSEFKNQKVKIKFNYKGKSGNLFIANPKIFNRVKKRKRYNVVYLLFDGVGTRFWSFYNNKSKLTPLMKAAIKNDYIIFDNMITMGNKTRISTSGLFTSVLPFQTRHGINRNFIPQEEQEIFYRLVREKQLASLPDIFKRNGYISAQIGNSGYTVNLITSGVDYGFERSYDFAYNPYDTYGLNHELFKFLRKNKDREYFVYTHYNTPHKPYYAPINYFIRGIKNANFKELWRPPYLGTLSYNDDVFDNINQAFKKNGMLDNTIIILATDHGSTYDVSKDQRGFNYNDVARLTFCVHLPPELKKKLNADKKNVKTYISSMNIAPTILDLIGIKPVKAFDGKSFKKTLANDYNKKTFDKYFWTFGRKTGAVIDENLHKYIFSSTDAKTNLHYEYFRSGQAREQTYEEIYDLNNDPWEKKNLVRERMDLLEKFRKIYFNAEIHHPERNVLTFYPHNNKTSKIIVSIKCKSELIKSMLLNPKMNRAQSLIKRKTNKDSYDFIFILKKEPVYLIFEHLEDRSSIQIKITKDGVNIPTNQIYATAMNINLFANPIILNNKKLFFVLNAIKLPLQEGWQGKKSDDLSIKISRLDLHRWIDIHKFDKTGISAGMKETLKSWGYIQ